MPTRKKTAAPLKLTSHEINILRTLVEFAALQTGDGAATGETTEIFLQHISNDESALRSFVVKAREALS
jgi:hypothetical protein